ncbi:BrxA family protein [Cognaticolwellia beringensis]|uniref:BrxA family protein n=1 Tax=Cognaticolwellia beringensis TaxID=1967665 RepID=UPI001C112F0F|nr:BrxA family protein [Cognaticolwellia beringensis]
MIPQANMQSHKGYLGDLIGGSLMIRESQIIAELLLKKPSKKEWTDAIVNQNVLQKRSDASSKRNAATIKKTFRRLKR